MFIAWRGVEDAGKQLNLLKDSDYDRYEELHNELLKHKMVMLMNVTIHMICDMRVKWIYTIMQLVL